MTEVLTTTPSALALQPQIRTLQIGNVWFEEQQGGLSRVYYELLRNLPKVNVQFRGLVVGRAQLGELYGRELYPFANTSRPLRQRLLKARASIKGHISSGDVDLVASHFALYTIPAIHEIRNLPLVVHFHGPWAAEANLEGSSRLKSAIQATIEKLVYRRATRLIVLSRAFARELTQRYKVQEESIRVISAGVDTKRFNGEVSKAEARERMGWPSDRFVVVAVRRLANRMGLEDLISATKILVKKAPEILVLIAGVGALQQELAMQIERSNLHAHVKLLGRVDDSILPLLYRAANLSVVPTIALEGFGMITLESLASGTPAMVTPVGGLPEVVQGLSSGLIFDSAGAISIAKGIEEVISGERKLPTDDECRAYTNTHFTWPIVAQNVRRVYAEALG